MSGTGLLTRHDYDEDHDAIVSIHTQDVEDIVETNKWMAGEQQKRADTFRLIASIPLIMIEKWIAEDGVNYLSLPADEFSRLIKRKLRDPQYRYLRTSSGNI